MSNTPARLRYIPQLDSFRFFAVLLVLFAHWLQNSVINIFPNGFAGVNFFFVLSGYLISCNLLYTKKLLAAHRLSPTRAIGNFFARRSLRIFPLYYLAIFLVLLLAPAVFNGHFGWYMAYMPNFLIFKMQEWPEMLSHLWSLGVEEQFYLVWPLLILLFPSAWLKYLFAATIFMSVAFKIYLFTPGKPFHNFYDVLPVSCFDAFAIGGLLALLMTGYMHAVLDRLQQIPAWMGFTISFFACWLVYLAGWSFLFGVSASAASFFIILKATAGYTGLAGHIVNNRVLQYLGKISYGLYVYHNFIPWLLRCLRGQETRYPLPLLPVVRAAWLQGPIPLFAVHFVLLVAVASISWYCIEKPINNLKKYFE